MTCKSILVVEDDKDLRLIISELLTNEGYLVHHTKNGQETLNYLLEKNIHNQLPGCMLLDIMMPVMSGIQLLEYLMANHPLLIDKIPICVWTAMRNPSTVLENLPLKIETLKKPIEIDELLQTIEKHCGSPKHKS